MNPLGFYALGSALLFLLTIPLIIFYFLKLKRPRLEISSLALWRQVLNDQRVNSPFQRFKRNLLLLLQLLLLTLVVLAAMQPFWRGTAAQAHHLPVLIDCSASMAALDKAGGLSRLEAARKKVAELIEGLPPENDLCLISFAHTARKLTGFTNNKRILREVLGQIEVEDVPSDIEDALRLAQALSRGVSFDEVLLISDGNLPSRADFELSFKLNYQRLPPAGPNMGITALNARRSEEGGWNVFAQIEGSEEAEGTAAVELTQVAAGDSIRLGGRDDTVVGTENLSLAKGQSQKMIFRVRGDKPSSLKLQLRPDGFDSLATDNVAYLELPATRPLRVFCPPSLVAYRHALAVLKGMELWPVDGQKVTTGFATANLAEGGDSTGREAPDVRYDLAITDRPEDLAQFTRTLFGVGIVPGDLQKLIAVEQKGAAVVEWRRNAPLLQHVELAEVMILDQPHALGEAQDSDFENLGYEVLVHGTRGPLLVEKREREKLSYFALFHTDHSTLPYRVGFPILVSNLVQVAMNEAGLAEASANRTGVLPPLSLTPNRVYQVEGPKTAKREEKSDGHGALAGIPAPRVGRYQISEGTSAVARVSASLLSPNETSLRIVKEIQFNEKLSVSVSQSRLKSDRPLWVWLAFLGFGCLLVEWWYFQRRPGGYGK